MKNYYRVMLGRKSVHAATCIAGNFIGGDFEIPQDLSGDLPDDWRAFNNKFIPIFLAGHPGKSKISAGLACGALWTIAKGIKASDLVLCPDGTGIYRVGEVSGEYYYVPGDVLPHRRPVLWLSQTINRADMSDALKYSTGSIGAISTITGYQDEIEKLIGRESKPLIMSTDGTIEDPIAFALEKHLEDFLVANWSKTDLGKSYDIYEEEGEKVGQQYPTDTGQIDILAISKDKKSLLAVELKKGRASDVVVGQVLRYMGYIQEELAEPGQKVRGLIIALEDDQRIKRALAVVPSIEFYRYQVSFHLVKA